MQSTQSFYLAPGNLDLVIATGADAAKLLQGQLTCDVEALSEGHFVRGAACNNKGRVYATFVLVRHADSFFLVFNHGVGSAFVDALKKFLPFYKCELQLAPPQWSCLAAAGSDTINLLTTRLGTLPAAGGCVSLPQGWLCRLTDEQVLACANDEGHTALLQCLSGTVPAAGAEAWQLRELLAGHFPFTADDIEKYTPQELQLDRHAYVSFSKGCYTGQEIVARMHYRGKVKKQLYLLSSEPGGSAEYDAECVIHNAQGPVPCTLLKEYRSDSGSLHRLVQLPVELAEQAPDLQDSNGRSLSLRVF